MPETYKVLARGQVTGATTAVYNPAAATQAIVKQISFAASGGASSFAVTVGAATPRAFIPATPLAAGEWAEWEGSLALTTGDALNLTVPAAMAIDYVVSGVEIT